MTKTSRKTASLEAYGWSPVKDLRRWARAGAIVFATGALGGTTLLLAQAMAARLRDYAKPDMRLGIRERVGSHDSSPLRLVLLGDSTALGVGVSTVTETLGGQLAELIAEGSAGLTVDLWSTAVASSRSSDLPTQVARALVGQTPHIAIILIGINDVLHLVPPSRAAQRLGSAVRHLRLAGVHVIVGTCLDIGAFHSFSHPLRYLLGQYSRKLAKKQAAAVRGAGGIPVDLGAQTGVVFRADAGTLCYDQFHPSADGYRVLAHALFPSVDNAIRLSRH